jgi:hypothetical protein
MTTDKQRKGDPNHKGSPYLLIEAVFTVVILGGPESTMGEALAKKSNLDQPSFQCCQI